MTSHSVYFPAVSTICAQVKRLGYAAAKRIRLYGEEFEVVSDPFPEADGWQFMLRQRKTQAFACCEFR